VAYQSLNPALFQGIGHKMFFFFVLFCFFRSHKQQHRRNKKDILVERKSKTKRDIPNSDVIGTEDLNFTDVHELGIPGMA
jgi:hypothetical protein